MLTRTYRALVPAGSPMLTVLPVAGLNVYPDAGTTVVNDEPLVLVCTESVCVRVAHAASGGSFSAIRPTLVAAPRSTCTHCGNEPLALSQYVAALPSVTLPGTSDAFAWLLAEAGLPAAML